MSWKHLVAAAAVLLVWALPAHAQPVQLRFHDGLVSLRTQNAPLRAILAEWARMGGATIVNGERVAGPPLTLELNAVPERQALDILLRGVSGYMLGTRPAGTAGTAVFDRILILPTSSAPRNPPPGAPGGFTPGRPAIPQPVRPPVIMPEQDLEEDPPQDVAPPDDDAPVVNPLTRPRPQFPGTGPQPMVEPDPADDQVEPDGEPTSIVPANPFGIPAGATSRPGVVTPVPQQQAQPRTPRADPEP